MENKYYTPKLEDIFEGYVFEYQSIETAQWLPDIYKFEWINSYEEASFIEYHDIGSIRTKYLDKDDIESLGWEMYTKGIDLWFKFKENLVGATYIQELYGYKPYNLYLNYGLHDHKMKINCDFMGGRDFNSSDTLFEGFIPSINELKKIMKWIEIL